MQCFGLSRWLELLNNQVVNFCSLERSKADGKISVLGVVNPIFHALVRPWSEPWHGSQKP